MAKIVPRPSTNAMACVAAERPVVAPRLGGMRASTATTWPEEPSSRRWCSTDQRMNLLKLASSTMPVVSTDTTEAVVYLRNEQQLGVVRSKQHAQQGATPATLTCKT